MTRLSELNFIDLYLGSDFADVKGLPGGHAARSALSGELSDEAHQLRAACVGTFNQYQEPEFAHEHDGVLYRVTVMCDIVNEPVIFLRRVSSEVRVFEELGISSKFVEWLSKPDLRGLVLIAGEMGAGKTTTCAALTVARLLWHGGVAITIEDPPEIRIEGVHGAGRCIQIPASSRFGNHSEQLRRAMRTGVHTMMIGEIRCDRTASEAIKHASNGIFVPATVHAASIPDAIDRVIFLAANAGAGHMLSRGIAAVIHMSMDRRVGADGNVVARPVFSTLKFDGDSADGMREKIRNSETQKLKTDIEEQVGRSLWR